jgi:ERCC4-like helicases
LQENYIKHPLVWPGAVEPRLYQINIAKSAYGRNTLVILPTALGKTVISALVTAETLYRRRNSKVLVLAPTRPLVMQHSRNFRAMLKLRDSDVAFFNWKDHS